MILPLSLFIVFKRIGESPPSISTKTSPLGKYWEKRLYSVTIVTTLIILAGLMHLVFTTHMKKKYYKGLYLQEIKKQEVQNSFHRAETILYSEENIFELTDINPLIVESILHSLEIFEKEKKYLNKNASLSNLAKECATNTSYMSKVVNHYKK